MALEGGSLGNPGSHLTGGLVRTPDGGYAMQTKPKGHTLRNTYRDLDPLNEMRLPTYYALMDGLKKAQRPDYSFYNSMKGQSPYRASAYRINTGPIWSQQQINQQVNAGTANIRANTQNDINSMYANMGARGFASRSSPLAMALEIQSRGMGNMGAANLDRDTRWNAAEGNARHVLAAQTAQGDLYARADATNAQSQGQFWSMLADAWNGARNSPNVSSYIQGLIGLFGTSPNLVVGSTQLVT